MQEQTQDTILLLLLLLFVVNVVFKDHDFVSFSVHAVITQPHPRAVHVGGRVKIPGGWRAREMAVEGYGSVWWGLSPPLDLLTINPPQDPIGG